MKKRILILLALVAALAMLAGQISAAHLADGLVAYWPFDDGVSPTADVAHGNDGTISGATYTGGGANAAPVPGNVDALNFAATGDLVRVPNNALLEPANVTVSAWVRNAGTPTSYDYILAKTLDGGKGSYAFYTRSSGGLWFYVSDALSYYVSDDAGPAIWDGGWHHIAGTYDGSLVRLFVDGSEIGTANTGPSAIAYGTAVFLGDLSIGSYGDLNPALADWRGDIDEVHIYDRALSLVEIAALADYSEFDVSLSPATDFNPVGTDHTVTATLDPALSFIPVLFEVTAGPNAGDSGTVSTDGSGEAAFTYMGDSDDGVDTIKACIDLDDNGDCDGDDPVATVTKTWFENFVTGGGKINFATGNTKKAEWTFGGTVGFLEGVGPVGQFQIVQHGSALACHFDTFTSLVFSGGPAESPPATHDTAVFEASGTCNDGSEPSVTVTIVDKAEPGKGADTIDTSGDLTLSGTIDGGNFQVHDIE